jgi:hypothetical protein
VDNTKQLAALIIEAQAIETLVEGMKWENEQRRQDNHAMAYDNINFTYYSEQLMEIVDKIKRTK